MIPNDCLLSCSALPRVLEYLNIEDKFVRLTCCSKIYSSVFTTSSFQNDFLTLNCRSALDLFDSSVDFSFLKLLPRLCVTVNTCWHDARNQRLISLFSRYLVSLKSLSWKIDCLEHSFRFGFDLIVLFPNLEELDLETSYFCTLGLYHDHLQFPQSLRSVRISGATITPIELDRLLVLPRLQSLMLPKTSLCCNDYEFLAAESTTLYHLKKLDIGTTNCEKDMIDPMRRNTKLDNWEVEHLALGACLLNTQNIKWLCSLSKLTTISLKTIILPEISLLCALPQQLTSFSFTCGQEILPNDQQKLLDDFASLFAKQATLTDLDLRLCHLDDLWTGDNIQIVLRSVVAILKHLALYDCMFEPVDGVKLESVPRTPYSLRSLQVLHLQTTNINDSSFIWLIEHQPYLEKLCVLGPSRLTVQALYFVGARCRSLKHLEIELGCQQENPEFQTYLDPEEVYFPCLVLLACCSYVLSHHKELFLQAPLEYCQVPGWGTTEILVLRNLARLKGLWCPNIDAVYKQYSVVSEPDKHKPYKTPREFPNNVARSNFFDRVAYLCCL